MMTLSFSPITSHVDRLFFCYRLIYWTAYNDHDHDTARVFRASMDGTNVTVLFNNDTVRTPNGLALDYDTQTLYFIDSRKHIIYKSTTDGEDLCLVYELGNRSFAVAMDYHDGVIYWGDRLVDRVFSLRVDRGLNEEAVLLSELPNRRDVGGIKVVDIRRQPMGSDPSELWE